MTSVTAVTIDELSQAVAGRVYGQTGAGGAVVDLTHDSRRVAQGWAFACVRGGHHDGHDYARSAIEAGASCLLVDHRLAYDIAQVVVDDVRACLGPAAAHVHGHPSRAIATVGVTGTAGKTSVTHAVSDIMSSAGRPCAVLGTLEGARTTPEAPDLQRWLASRVAAGDQCAAIEVSSHALELGRADAVDFRVGVFTNLGPEHLDFHRTMDAYYSAKARLFDGRSRVAVVNRDDVYGRRLVGSVAPGTEVVTYGIDDVDDVVLTAAGSRFSWRGHDIRTGLVGAFNLVNLAGAATTALVLGIDEAGVAAAIPDVRAVRGRMDPVLVNGSDITVVVDYSHKPDALRAALDSARDFTQGRLWVVFGAGGDRDRAKRPLMGRAAQDVADWAVVTSDNPRGEDPDAIIAEIIPSMVEPIIEPDRNAAIALAILAAESGDVVVVAGKGHETTQIVGSTVVPFDDVAVARGHLEQRVRRLKHIG